MFEKVREIIISNLSCDAQRVTMDADLVEDVGLLKNILCAGLWSAFNRKYGKRKES